MAKLLSKESVNYRKGGDMKRCETCAMFNGNGKSCDLVQGPIQYNMLCDRWVARNRGK